VTRTSTIAVVAGALGALLLVAALRQSVLGVIFGAMLSPLPLAMVAFSLGAAYLPLAVVAGAITVAVMYQGAFTLAILYLAVDAAPVAVLSRLGLAAALAGPGSPVAGAAVGRTICLLVLAAVGALIAGLAMMSAGPDGIEATLRARLDEVLAMAPAAGPGPGGIDLTATRTEMVRALAGLLPGVAAWDWCLRAILSAALAQMMLKRMNLATWPTPAYREFEVPKWFVTAFAVTVIAAVVLKNDAGFIAGNAAAVMSLPLVLQGLAVVHSAAAGLKQRLIWLTVFYVLALVMTSVSAVLLVGLGVMDHFMQIRARYLAPRTGGE
jgi:hypothetical protein